MAEYVSNPLIELIKERALLDDLQLDEVVQEHLRSGKSIEQLLQDFGLMDIDTQLQIKAEAMGTMVVNIQDFQLTPDILETVPAETARMYQALPVAVYGTTVQVALAERLPPSPLIV